MSDAEEQFLLEGIKRYAPALATIGAFETMMEERIGRVAKAYVFDGVTPTKELIRTGTQESGGAYWIWAIHPRMFQPKKALGALEIGMAWKGDQVAYYGNLLDEDGEVINISYSRKHPRIEPRMWSKKPRLFMLSSANGTFDLDVEFKILLDELLLSYK